MLSQRNYVGSCIIRVLCFLKRFEAPAVASIPLAEAFKAIMKKGQQPPNSHVLLFSVLRSWFWFLKFALHRFFSALDPWQLPISLAQAISTTTASGALLPTVWWSHLSSAIKRVCTNVPLYILCHLPHPGFQLLLKTSQPFFLSYQATHGCIWFCSTQFLHAQKVCKLFTPSNSLILLEATYHEGFHIRAAALCWRGLF